MVQDKLDELRLVKCELENARGHKYGLWSRLEENDTFVYKRSCIKCKHTEEIVTSSIDLGIERVIKNQNEAVKFTNFFCNSSNEALTNENILLFLAETTSYHPFMNIDKIIEKILKVNNGYVIHNNEEENLIFNTVLWLKKTGDIPEELIQSIYNHLNKLAHLNNGEIEVVSHSSRKTI